MGRDRTEIGPEPIENFPEGIAGDSEFESANDVYRRMISKTDSSNISSRKDQEDSESIIYGRKSIYGSIFLH